MSAIQHITMDDGCRIACEFRAIGDRPVVVLSTSLGTSMGLFDAQMEALSQDFSVLRYDPRGHGHSDVPQGAYSLDRLGRDVVGLLDAFSIERAHFVGVSIGGMIGQWLGYRTPERFLSLTLANTSAYMGPPSGWSERISAVLENGMEPMVEPVIGRWFTPAFRAEHAEKVAPISAILRATDRVGYAGCSAAIRDMDLRPTAPLIKLPTLVISGLQDPATPPEHSDFLVQAVEGAQLASLDAAHLSNVEQSSLFNQAVTNFLEAQ
jgi:3-oxoadipate enol-lactonase